MPHGTQRFQPITRFDPITKERRTLQVITCGACSFEGELLYRTSALPDVVVEKKFSQRGWRVDKRSGRVRCPKCIHLEEITKAQHEPAPRKEEPMPANDTEPTARNKLLGIEPPPPRQPSAADNRRIMDAFETVWDEREEAYIGTMSDDRLAEQLDVPRVWVTKVRELVGGPEDRNLAEAEKAQQLRKLQTELDDLNTRVIETLTTLDKAIGTMKAKVRQALNEKGL